MDKDPEIRSLALTAAEKLAAALVESIKKEKKLKDGERQEYEHSPAHIAGEIQTLCNGFLH